MITIFQMRCPRHREGDVLAQGYTADGFQGQDTISSQCLEPQALDSNSSWPL